MSKENKELFRCEDKPKVPVIKKIVRNIKKLESDKAVKVSNLRAGTAEFNGAKIDSSNSPLRQSRFLREIYVGIVAWTMCRTSKGSECLEIITRFSENSASVKTSKRKSKNRGIIRGGSQ